MSAVSETAGLEVRAAARATTDPDSILRGADTTSPLWSINLTDIVIEYASRLWMKLIAGGMQYRVGDISKEFTSDGWKSLLQELVGVILSYLSDDMEALKA